MAADPSQEILRRALDLCRFRRATGLVAGLLAAGLVAMAGLGALVLLTVLSAPPGARLTCLVLTAATLVAVLVWAAWRVSRPFPPTRAAVLAESRFPDLRDRFVTAVELAWSSHLGPPSGRPSGYPLVPSSVAGSSSSALARAVVEDAEGAVRSLNLREVVDTRPVRRLALAAAVAALALIALSLAFPGAWANVLSPVDRRAAAPLPLARPSAPPPAALGPGIADIALRLDYPPYTGLPSERRTTDLDTVSALIGTRVTITARLLGQPARAEAVRDGSAQPLTIGPGHEVSARFVLARTTTWSLRATDPAGRSAATPLGKLIALPDRPPRVALTQPGKSLTLDAPGVVRLAYEASDDWGLTALALEYKAPGDSRWRSVPLSTATGKTASGAFDWDLVPLRLSRGQAVAYRVTARDNDAVSGPKTTATSVYTVSIGEPAAPVTPAEAAQEATTNEAEGLDELEEQAEELGRRLDETIAALEKGETTPEEQARRGAELAEACQRIAEQADRVSKALDESERKLSAEGAAPSELREKMQELRDLLQQAMNEDLQQVLDQIQEALKGLKPEDFRQSLQQAKQAQEDFAARLDQAIQLLKRLRLEQEIAQAADQAEKLAQDQAKQNESRDKLKPGEAEQARQQAAEQTKLQEREAGLESDLQRLSQDAQPIDRSAAAQVGKTAQDLQQSGAQQAMKQAAGKLQEGDPSGAQAPQQQALSALNQAAASLREMQASMTAAARQNLARAAEQMTRDALYLSRGQEQLMGSAGQRDALNARSASQGKAERERLRREQEALEKGTRDLAGRMQELARQSPMVDPALAQQAGEVADSMAQAARETAAGAGPQSAATQREAMSGLNELAEELLRLGERMQQGAQGMAMQQLLQQLQALAQQQRGLNQQTEQQGSGSTPRRQGSSGQLADQQRQIREALERLLQNAGQPSGLPDKLGDVPAQMDDVEQQLRQERPGERMLQQQRDILHRMLDAQRSVYKRDEQQRQRVAERPKPFRLPPSPPELRPRAAPPPGPRITAAGDAGLPLDYEDLVREYFRTLAEHR